MNSSLDNFEDEDDAEGPNMHEMYAMAHNSMRELVRAYEHLSMDTPKDQELHDRLTRTAHECLDRLTLAISISANKFPRVKADYVAEMAYVYMREREPKDVAKTYELDHGVNVDLDHEGNVLGYEIYLR